MKKYKNNLLLGIPIVCLTPLSVLVSCNVNLKSNTKYNKISHYELYESNNGKTLIKLLKNNFKTNFLASAWTNWFLDAAAVVNGETVSKYIPPLSQSSNQQDMTQNLLKNKKGHGNFAGDLYDKIESNIFENKEIDPNIRSLLNKIRTIYNRTKQIYPIQQEIFERDGVKWGKYIFQVDLISTLERKTMENYIQVEGEVPLLRPSEDLYNKIYSFDRPLSNNSTMKQVMKLIFGGGARIYGKPRNFWVDSQYMNKTHIDWSNLIISTLNDKYIIKGYKFDGDWTRPQQVGNKTFDKNAKLQEVSDYLQKMMFENNASPYVSQMFTKPNNLKGKIKIVSIAGNSIEGETITSYIQNYAISYKDTYSRDFGNFNIYISNKNNPSMSWLKIGAKLSSDAGKTVL